MNINDPLLNDWLIREMEFEMERLSVSLDDVHRWLTTDEVPSDPQRTVLYECLSAYCHILFRGGTAVHEPEGGGAAHPEPSDSVSSQSPITPPVLEPLSPISTEHSNVEHLGETQGALKLPDLGTAAFDAADAEESETVILSKPGKSYQERIAWTKEQDDRLHGIVRDQMTKSNPLRRAKGRRMCHSDWVAVAKALNAQNQRDGIRKRSVSAVQQRYCKGNGRPHKKRRKRNQSECAGNEAPEAAIPDLENIVDSKGAEAKKESVGTVRRKRRRSSYFNKTCSECPQIDSKRQRVS